MNATSSRTKEDRESKWFRQVGGEGAKQEGKFEIEMKMTKNEKSERKWRWRVVHGVVEAKIKVLKN